MRSTLAASVLTLLALAPAAALAHQGESAAPGASMHFSVSHSGDLAVIGVTREVPLGVDIDKLGPPPRSGFVQWAVSMAVSITRGSSTALTAATTAWSSSFCRRVTLFEHAGAPLRRCVVHP
jgi:phosphopantetheinyl transferase